MTKILLYLALKAIILINKITIRLKKKIKQ